jgi:hypothetical protein
MVISNDHTLIPIAGHDLDLGPGYYTALVRLANRAALQRLRGRRLRHDPKAVFEFVDDSRLTLTLGVADQPSQPATAADASG